MSLYNYQSEKRGRYIIILPEINLCMMNRRIGELEKIVRANKWIGRKQSHCLSANIT